MRKEYERKGKRQGGPLKCYGCGELGHIKPNCPNIKKEKKPEKKQRAYISWGGDSRDESSDGEEETANVCLMAHEESQNEVCISSKIIFSLEEMQDAFDELYDEFINASKIIKDLRNQHSVKEKDFKKLILENEKLKEENRFYGKRSADKPESSNKSCSSCKSLKEEVDRLKSTLHKFNSSHKNLNDVLVNLKSTKHGIGFKNEEKVESIHKPPKTQPRPNKINANPQPRNINPRVVNYPRTNIRRNVGTYRPPRQDF